MASISLMLKDNNATGKTRIIAKLTDGRNTQIRISSGHSILPKHWSREKKFVLSANHNASAINKYLKGLQSKMLSIYSEAIKEGIIPNRKYIDDKLKPTIEAIELETSFWKVFDYYLIDNKTKFSKNTVTKFKALKTHLLAFEEYRKIPFEFNAITIKVMGEFQAYFYEEANLVTQTTAKYLEVFKMYLNWTVKNKYNEYTEFREFKITQQPHTIKAVLSDNDLHKLRSFKTTEKLYLINVRELLILSCFTGLRYSDYSKIRLEHLKKDSSGNYSLLIMQKKTNNYVEVPLIEEVLKIVNKIYSKEIHPISNQKMNEYAKELCKLCKIDEGFEKIEYRGNLKVTKTIPKHEVITTHTGRRTFATNLLLKGVPAEVVMTFTGHKDYGSFSKYVNIPKNTKMKLVREALA